ncbi:MAG: tail fiber domain-containing protein [Chitinophagales bacterium]|nr:tail fiber domain-containing protein [Chitinophagales bacterium]
MEAYKNVTNPDANYTVAEFRSRFDERSSVGIKVRGSRNSITDFCAAHIDLSNFDDDEGVGGTEFEMARLCSDMQTPTGQTGFFHIFTRNGATDFSSKFLIDNIGLTGVGTAFLMNGANFNGPKRRLHVDDATDAPQFRISQTYNLDPALGVYTDFQSTSSGDLLINPQSGVTDKNVGINLSSSNLPTSTLDINGDLRIRTIVPNPALTTVLVVDANGLVQSRTLPNSGGVAACSSGLFNNYVTKVTDQTLNQICISQIFDDGTYVGIGTISGFTAKLNVKTSAINLGIYSEGLVYGAYGKSTGSIGSSNSINGLYGEASGASNSAGDNVGVYGIVTSSVPSAKNYGMLGKSEVTSSENTGMYGIAKNATSKNIGLKAYAQTATSTALNFGIYSEANGGGLAMAENRGVKGYAYGSTNINAGLYGLGEGGSAAIGVHGLALSSTTNNYGIVGETYSSNVNNFGIYGTAKNATNSYGVYGIIPSGPGNRYGVFGKVNGTTNAGSTAYAVYGDAGGSLNDYAGYFNGSIANTNGFYQASDSLLKTDFEQITDAMEVLSKIIPYTYSFKTDQFPSMNLSSDKQIPGFVAENIQQYIPTAVKQIIHPAQYDSTGALTAEAVKYEGVDYSRVIPYLVAGYNDLKKQLDDCCSTKM